MTATKDTAPKPKSYYTVVRDKNGKPVKFGRVTLLVHTNGMFYCGWWDKKEKKAMRQSTLTRVRKEADIECRAKDAELKGLLSRAVALIAEPDEPKTTLEEALDLGIAMRVGGQYYKEALATYKSAFLKWRNRYAPELKTWAQFSPPQKAIPPYARAWVNQLIQEGKTRHTVVDYLQVVRFASIAMHDAYPDRFPLLSLNSLAPEEEDRPLAYLSAEQAVKLYRWGAEHRKFAMRSAAFAFALGAFAGLRITEMIRLKWSDLEGDVLTIRNPESRRGGKTQAGLRVIPVPYIVVEAWERWKSEQRIKDTRSDARVLKNVLRVVSNKVHDLLEEARGTEALNDPDYNIVPTDAMRATFMNIMEDANVDDKHQDAIVGHAPSQARVRRKQYRSIKVHPETKEHIKSRQVEQLRDRAIRPVENELRRVDKDYPKKYANPVVIDLTTSAPVEEERANR